MDERLYPQPFDPERRYSLGGDRCPLTQRPNRQRLSLRANMNYEEEPPPQRDSRWEVHLLWMFENQPELVLQLDRERKLGEHLDNKYQEALSVVEKLKNQGLSETEAFDVALEQVLSPPDGPAISDNPPSPVPWKEQRQIANKLFEEEETPSLQPT